jgi:hypothetical protein
LAAAVLDQKQAVLDQKRRVLDQKRRVLDQKQAVLDQKRRVLDQKQTGFIPVITGRRFERLHKNRFWIYLKHGL